MKINKIMRADQALGFLKDGDSVMIGGFGFRGCPLALVDALVATNKKNLTIITNDLGNSGEGLGNVLLNQQIKHLIGTYFTWNRDVAEAKNRGEIVVTLIPQGSFAESIRAGGMGIPAYYALASEGTEIGEGKEVRMFNGRNYVLEHALTADVALIRAYKSDTLGNLIYYKTSRNFNPAMATAAKYTIVEVEQIVPAGELTPEEIVTPHIYVDAIVKGGEYQWA